MLNSFIKAEGNKDDKQKKEKQKKRKKRKKRREGKIMKPIKRKTKEESIGEEV